MRTPKYLSPSSIDMWVKDREAFYVNYLSENRIDRPPQTAPMAIGSGFDAYVKNYLFSILGDVPDGFDLQTLFNSQVEEQNRHLQPECEWVFEQYKNTYMCEGLVAMLKSASEYNFEFTEQREVEGVPLLGKPDAYLVVAGTGLILDWKVNGFMSKSNVSPNKGYILCEDMWSEGSHSRSHMTVHKDVICMELDGYKFTSCYFDEINQGWALQLSIYGWLMGCTPGTDFLGQIDQIACSGKDRDSDGRPKMRLARFRSLISARYQERLLGMIKDIWQRIQRGAIFDQDNDAKIAEMDSITGGDALDKLLYRSSRY